MQPVNFFPFNFCDIICYLLHLVFYFALPERKLSAPRTYIGLFYCIKFCKMPCLFILFFCKESKDLLVFLISFCKLSLKSLLSSMLLSEEQPQSRRQ
jgi:hypothetical protein